MGLSWETFEIIVALRRNGTPFEMKPTELYKATFLTSGAMTNRLDRAQEAGLIIRVPDPDDRRGLLIRLTPAGKCLGDAAFERYNKEIHQLMGHLALEQRTEVVNLLRTLLSPFETSPTEDKGNRAS
jgi:DNA-binding MarR family transcriptional regulator